MVYYINRKRFILPVILCIALIVAAYWIMDHLDSTGFFRDRDPSEAMVYFLILGFILGLAGLIGAIVNLFHLLRGQKTALTLSEQGVFISLTKAYRRAGLIGWNEISKIEKSTDNMNKPAVRITLKDHKKGEYQFYLPCKQLGVKQSELLDSLIQYYTAAQDTSLR
jgi:predicted PurR-regulated permease PerM